MKLRRLRCIILALVFSASVWRDLAADQTRVSILVYRHEDYILINILKIIYIHLDSRSTLQ